MRIKDDLLVISCGAHSRLEKVLDFALAGLRFERFEMLKDTLPSLRQRRVLFALSVGSAGMDQSICALLIHLRAHSDAMEGSVAAILVDGKGELYTKQVARMLALAANQCGCMFPGKSLVEATGSLQNWSVQAKNRNMSHEDAYRAAAVELVRRLISFRAPKRNKAKVLVLHASDRRTSNTLALGESVAARLVPYCEIKELSLQNGTVFDCRGCSYKTCSHFAAQNSCFYGGSIVDDVYPAIMDCDALLMLCPNYNDSLSANLAAFINRLTALLVYNSLYDKYLYAIVVSGYSGSDIVAQQLLGSMCFNKTFILPPRFSFLQTANDPGSALLLPGIDNLLDSYAQNILTTITDLVSH